MKITLKELKSLIRETIRETLLLESASEKQLLALIERGKNKKETGMEPWMFAKQLYQMSTLSDKELSDKELLVVKTAYLKQGYTTGQLNLAAKSIDPNVEKY